MNEEKGYFNRHINIISSSNRKEAFPIMDTLAISNVIDI